MLLDWNVVVDQFLQVIILVWYDIDKKGCFWEWDCCFVLKVLQVMDQNVNGFIWFCLEVVVDEMG